MTDIYSPAKRSEVMGKVRAQNTAAERLLRSALHRAGLRFRLNVRTLPGRPDIVLRRYRAAIFVHGCFWHQHEGCKRARVPKSNLQFWAAKLARNVERDRTTAERLTAAGWNVVTVWECELLKDVAGTACCVRAAII